MSKTKRAEIRMQMASLLKEWRVSGEAGRKFASRKGITAEKFYYWKRRLAGGERSEAMRRPQFVPVRLEGAWEAAGLLEIILESGERVRISEGVSEQTLRRAIQVLRERC